MVVARGQGQSHLPAALNALSLWKVRRADTHVGSIAVFVDIITDMLPIIESGAVVCCVTIGIKETEWQIRAAEDGKTDLFRDIVRVGQRFELAHWRGTLCSTRARDESVEIRSAVCYILAMKE